MFSVEIDNQTIVLEEPDYLSLKSKTIDSLCNIRDKLEELEILVNNLKLPDSNSLVFKAHRNTVRTLTPGYSNSFFSGSWDKTICFWCASDGSKLLSFDDSNGIINSIVFNPDTKYIFSASGEPDIAIWDVGNGERIGELKGHKAYVLTLVLSFDCKFLYSGCIDGTIKVWDLNSEIKESSHTFYEHKGSVNQIVLAKNQLLFSGSDDKRIGVIDTKNNTVLKMLEGHEDAVWVIACANEKLYSADLRHFIRVWSIDRNNSLCINQINLNQWRPDSITIGPDSRLYLGCTDGLVRVLTDDVSGDFEEIHKKHTGFVHSIFFSQEGALISGAADGRIVIWKETVFLPKSLMNVRGLLNLIKKLLNNCVFLKSSESQVEFNIEYAFSELREGIDDINSQIDRMLSIMDYIAQGWLVHRLPLAELKPLMMQFLKRLVYSLKTFLNNQEVLKDDYTKSLSRLNTNHDILHPNIIIKSQQLLNCSYTLLKLVDKEFKDEEVVCKGMVFEDIKFKSMSAANSEKLKELERQYNQLYEKCDVTSLTNQPIWELIEQNLGRIRSFFESVKSFYYVKVHGKRIESNNETFLSLDAHEVVAVLEEFEHEYHCRRYNGVEGRVSKENIQNRLDEEKSKEKRIVESYLCRHIANDYVLDSLKVDFSNKIKLGIGGFGEVVSATWKNTTVAVKRFRNVISLKEKKNLIKEAAIMSRLDSPHIVRFKGIFLYKGNYSIMMDYFKLGSLRDFITGRQKNEILRNSLVQSRFACNLAQGLYYLHSNGILHRDLKSHNVLLNKKLEPKLCDFGLAKTKNNLYTKSSRANAPTLLWRALEVFKSAEYTEAADVYSYGLVLFELLTGELPYSSYKGRGMDGALKQALERREPFGVIPEQAPEEFKDIINKCASHVPRERPTLDQVIGSFSELTQRLCSTALESLPMVVEQARTSDQNQPYSHMKLPGE